MRVSEILQLSHGDIPFQENQIKISGKGKKERYVVILDIVERKIQDYIETLFNSKEIEVKKSDPLFMKIPYNEIKPMTTRDVQRSMQKLIKIYPHFLPPNMTAHSLRHSFATHLLKNGLEILKRNIENEKGNLTRFLIMGKNISQPEFSNKRYITSFLFKLKSKPAALYQSLGGFAINGVNLTKLQSYPEKNSFDSFFFLCDLDGHIEDLKVQKSLEELGLHCQDFHVLGVFEADKNREK